MLVDMDTVVANCKIIYGFNFMDTDSLTKYIFKQNWILNIHSNP